MLPPAVIDPLVKVPTRVQLFAFSAATWNAHRIHYDPDYARDEGYPDIIVQSHLHANFVLQALMKTLGPDARVQRFSFQNRAFALPDQRLTTRGKLLDKRSVPNGLQLEYELEEVNDRGDVCVRALATVLLPEDR
jgi:hydroxyacyl-ACP dehydratase HTD2-like protein with hotdog domain